MLWCQPDNWELNHIVVSTYPRTPWPASYCAQAGPSEGASRGVVKRDRRAVAAHGCNTHTQSAAAGVAWSRRHRWRHRALWWQRRNSVPNGQALQQPKAVDRKLSHRGPCGGKPQNTARGTLERRRTCGFTNTGRRSRPRSSFRLGTVRCRGPWVRWTPGVPRSLGLSESAHRPK
jgi:hypothetical protein